MPNKKPLLTPANLREYQHLINAHQIDVPRSCVWAGMGLGKGAATLTTIDALIMAGESAPSLVLGPKRVAKTVWPEEAKKWSHTKHLKVLPITGTEKQRIQVLRYDAEVFTLNYEQLPWLVDYFGDRWPFRNVFPDESSKLKGMRLRQGGIRTAALSKVAHTKIKRISELTGTPAPNGLQDLYGQLWFVDRGNRLGRTYEAFKQRWFRPSPTGYGSVALPHAMGEIQHLLRDVCITIEAKDWFDLKDPIVTNIEIDLPAKARELYEQMEDEYFMLLETGEEIEAFNGAARSQKLLQVCSGAAYLNQEVDSDNHPKARQWRVLHDEKLDALDDILEEASGSPVMVAYWFKSDLARLQKKYPEGKWLSDDQQLADFKTGNYRVGFGNPSSIGHGTDGLQEHCNIMVNFSQIWNLEFVQQMLERIGPVRQMQAGKDRNVFVYNILARNTIDEDVAERMLSKATVQDTLRSAMRRRRLV